MHWTRRRFLNTAALSTGALVSSRAFTQMQMKHEVIHGIHTMDATRLTPFVDPLPLPVLQTPQGTRSSQQHNATDAPYYNVSVHAVQDKLHRDLPSTQLWSYNGTTSAPILFDVRSHQGVLIDWVNNLPSQHILNIHTKGMDMHDMQDAPETRISTHVHGARVPSISDGYPDDWFGPGKNRLNYYPNRQDATALWFHDHAMGNSRFNIFAGLMGHYILRDDVEDKLNLPSGKYELPLLLYDRSFTPQGQLYYPNPPDEGAWTQEYLGDAMVINGKVTPFHEVEPRKYRLRIVNSANSRFFAITFSNEQSFHVIGSDQGLLAEPIQRARVVIAPSERTDIIVDFSNARGQNIQMMSDRIPLMQFRVSSTKVDDTSNLPATLRPSPRVPESNAIRTRAMTLNQFDSDTGQAMVMLLNRKHWAEPVTEIVKLDTTEIWTLINLTEDAHPIHLHLVRFQVLDRQSFADYEYLANEKILPTGPRTPPDPHELGWKDVVQCPPYSITRIIVPFPSYTGRYVWHCHILEHEANDMMRPFHVIA